MDSASAKPQPKSTAGKPSSPRRGKYPLARTLGPVSDLERHLPQEWWKDLFNSLYLKTDGDVVENDQNTVKDIDLVLKTTGIQPTDHVLDLCCGQGRHSLELASRGYRNVAGVDRSRYLIRLARKRARTRGLAGDFLRRRCAPFSRPGKLQGLCDGDGQLLRLLRARR